VALAACVLGLLFAALHGAGAPAMLRAVPAPRASGEIGAVPRWARIAWVALVAVTAVVSVALVGAHTAPVVALLAVGVIGIAVLAVANGFWMQGTPTVSHHVVRFAMAAVVLVPAVLAAR
jgi:hypothetical protein